MEPANTDVSDQRNDGRGGSQQPDPPRPWRTEGVDEGHEPQRPRWGRLALLFFLGYLLTFGLFTLQDQFHGAVEISYTEFLAQVEAGNVSEVFARGDSLQGSLTAPRTRPGAPATTYETFVTERPTFAQDDLIAELERHDATITATPVIEERGPLTNLLLSFGPLLLLIGFWYWIFRRQRNAMAGGGIFGGRGKKEPIDPESVRVTFDDVAGIDEVVDEISEIVDFLRDPTRYRKLGARAPKGVLLTGAPGTGKTLLARATAGEAGVPFFSASASEFIEMIVGVGAQRVRELFEEARKVAPSIIFIDEIDTIGRARGGSHSVGGHDEREQTLNQILTEMDGFSGSENVVVLAATNRPDVLDPALLRAGRFDRSVVVHAPDREGRAAILGIHTRSVPLAPDVDLDQIASMTPGMTGADLENLANEAALLAARRGQSQVTTSDLTEALEKVQLGTARKVVMPEEERRRTAYHEAGHALIGLLTPGADPVRKVSIIPRGRALGVTLSTPEEDRYGLDEDYLLGRIEGALGGMAAEAEVFGVTSTGAESDLETATSVARSMVGRWGMSDKIGPVSALPREGDPRLMGASDALLDAVDAEVRRVIDEAYANARQTLIDNREHLDSLAQALLERETLDEADIAIAAGLPAREGVESTTDR